MCSSPLLASSFLRSRCFSSTSSFNLSASVTLPSSRSLEKEKSVNIILQPSPPSQNLRFRYELCWCKYTPLVRAEARVCGWQDLLQFRRELVKLSGVTWEPIILKIIFRLRICGLQRNRERRSQVKNFRLKSLHAHCKMKQIIPLKLMLQRGETVTRLTGLPEALWVG